MKKELTLQRLNKLIWYCIILYAASNIFSIVIVQIAAVLIFVLFIGKKIYLKDFSLSQNPLNIPFLIFIAARIISVFLSIDLNISLPVLYKEIFFYLLFYIFINEIEIKNKDKVTLLFKIIILAAFLAVIYGMVIYIFVNKDRISSTTSGYYTLGMYLCAALPISISLGKKKEFFPSRYLWWIVNLTLIIGILFTFDRMHWLSMTVTILITGIWKERKFLIIYLILAAFLLYFIPTLNERLMMSIKDFDFSKREIIWKGALMLFDKHPFFGFGPGTFKVIFPIYGELIDKAVGNWHNDFIQLYVESGLVGLISFLYLIVMLFRCGFKNRTDISAGLQLSLLAFIIGGFISDIINILFFILLMSLLAASCSSKVISEASSDKSRK